MTTLKLDICAPEGKTWLARIVGPDPKYGLARQFVGALERKTSRSGLTGSAVYHVDDGLYESHEGRRRLGKRYWRVENEQAVQITRDELLEALKESRP